MIQLRFVVVLAALFAITLSAQEKVVFKQTDASTTQIAEGKTWNAQGVMKTSLPVAAHFKDAFIVNPDKVYTLTAEARANGPKITQSVFWIGFISTDKNGKLIESAANNRVFPELATVVSKNNAAARYIIVKGNLERWERAAVTPVMIAFYDDPHEARDPNEPNYKLFKTLPNGVTRVDKNTWKISFSRYLAQGCPAGTKLALHYPFNMFDVVPHQKLTGKWTKFQGRFTVKGNPDAAALADGKSCVVVSFSCGDTEGQLELRNVKVVESSK